MRVILWEMAGRQPNMELQLPLIRHILASHPEVEFHLWNMARNDSDNDYVRAVAGPGITVNNSVYHYGPRAAQQADWEVWRHYGRPEYQDCLFIKIDDDVVFLQARRFGALVEALRSHPGSVVSANVINNEASSPIEPRLWEGVRPLLTNLSRPQPEWWQSIPWLTAERVRLKNFDHSFTFAQMAHNYFFNHHQEMLEQSIQAIPTQHYVSLHLVGYDWTVSQAIAQHIGPTTAGGDTSGGGACEETLASQFPCLILRGFMAAHLLFGAQEHAGHCLYGAQGHESLVAGWRERYGEIGQAYLAAL